MTIFLSHKEILSTTVPRHDYLLKQMLELESHKKIIHVKISLSGGWTNLLKLD